MTGSYKQGRKGLTAGNTASIAQVLIVAAILVGIILVFAGCGGGGLQGTWVNQEKGETVVITGDTITVTSDSTGTTGTLEFNYTVDGNTLTLSMEGVADKMAATYKLDGDTLTMSANGEDTVYTRK